MTRAKCLGSRLFPAHFFRVPPRLSPNWYEATWSQFRVNNLMYLSLGCSLFWVWAQGTAHFGPYLCFDFVTWCFRQGTAIFTATTSTATPTTCPSIGGPILLMSIMSVYKDITLLEEKGDMTIQRVHIKMARYWGRGGHCYREGK